MVERWAMVPSNPRYQVSTEGRVTGVWGRLMSASINNRGYRRVVLHWKGGRTQHRYVGTLVLEAFVGPRPDGMVMRHLNDVRVDDRVLNLAWGTRQENVDDMLRNHGGHYHSLRSRCKRGHAFTPENTGYRRDAPPGRVWRVCLACAADNARRFQARRGPKEHA